MIQFTKQETSSFTQSSANILVHVIILFTFISMLFFVYISKVESEAFRNELGSKIEDTINDLIDKNPQVLEKISIAKPFIEKLMKVYDKPMRSTIEHNITIKLMSMFTVLILLGILLTIIVTVTFECGENIPIGHILVKNIIIFTFIGIIEFMFFTKVAIKYIPVSPSTMVDTMISVAKSTLDNELKK
jgi:hypothetical protein